MFGEQFYPSPPELIDELVAPYLRSYRDLGIKIYFPRFTSILEPQAGRGDIVDRLVEKYEVPKRIISCIELDPDLRSVLRSKEYRVIGSNFLTFSDPFYADLILMNPPFAEGVEHLLKAWELSQGGDIACVLNAKTIRDPYSKDRQILKQLIEKYGRYEFRQHMFKEADRPSNVEVALVWLKKPAKDSKVLFTGDYDRDAKFDAETFEANFLASRDMLTSVVAQYEGAREALLDQHRAMAKYRFYVNGLRMHTEQPQQAGAALNQSLDELKQVFWNYIFEKTKFGQATTSDFQDRFSKLAAELGNLAFTLENVEEILMEFVRNQGAILRECILETFDKACAYHEKNKIHREGWVTNKSWMCAKRIIMPDGVSYDGYWSVAYRQQKFFSDIDKCMCFLDGVPFEKIVGLSESIQSRIDAIRNSGGNEEWQESTYFRFRFYKKGTVHVDFKRDDLWTKFNREAAKGKNWLGDGS